MAEPGLCSCAQIVLDFYPAPLITGGAALISDPFAEAADGQNTFEPLDMAKGFFKLIDFFPEHSFLMIKSLYHEVECIGELSHEVDPLGIIAAGDLLGLPRKMLKAGMKLFKW